jgi:hypothetical protein
MLLFIIAAAIFIVAACIAMFPPEGPDSVSGQWLREYRGSTTR